MKTEPEKDSGVDVFVSMQAEAAKKIGCLCIHQEPMDENDPEQGTKREVVCKHLRKNIAYEKGLNVNNTGYSKQNREVIIRDVLTNRAASEMNLLANVREGQISEKDGVCRLILINYATYVATKTEMAVTHCSHYEPEELD